MCVLEIVETNALMHAGDNIEEKICCLKFYVHEYVQSEMLKERIKRANKSFSERVKLKANCQWHM